MPRPVEHRGIPPSPSDRPGRTRIRRRYHFGAGGYLYVFVTLLVALGAFNSQNNLLYWTFGFALALLLVSGVISGAMLMGVRVEREWIAAGAAGEPVRIRYQVRNINRLLPAFALTIEEKGFAAPPPRRRWLIGPRIPSPPTPPPVLSAPRAFVAHVGPGETVRPEATARALRRGPFTLTEIIIHTGFPFGLMRKSLHIPRHAGSVITPALAPLDQELLRRATDAALTGSPSLRPGRGEEFFSLREYSPGDSPRDVAWRASAKRGALLVRQHALPAPDRLWIVLHLRPHPGSDADDERAISIAAALAAKAEARGMDYGLAVPLTRLLVHPRRGGGHLRRLTTDLGLLELGPDDGRGAAAAFPRQAGGKNDACIVIQAGASAPAFAPARERITTVRAGQPAGSAASP